MTPGLCLQVHHMPCLPPGQFFPPPFPPRPPPAMTQGLLIWPLPLALSKRFLALAFCCLPNVLALLEVFQNFMGTCTSHFLVPSPGFAGVSSLSIHMYHERQKVVGLKYSGSLPPTGETWSELSAVDSS